MTRSRGINQPKATWTPARDRQLAKLYPDHTAAEIARRMGLRLPQVYNRAQLLGLSKSEAFLASDKAGRIQRGKQSEAMRATQFKPGHVSHNKGVPMAADVYAKCAVTMFRPGRPASEARNYVPVGTEKHDVKRGVTVRKITDDPAIVPAQRWRPVHVLVWEAANGPVPSGHICVFRPGMKTLDSSRITADRLEIITLAENMRRNSYLTRYPKEVADVIRLRGALNRKINNRTKRREAA